MINGLSQTLLKITSPGVADFYQGSELWDFRLVDPDNRGPVDFERRSAALKEITAAGLTESRGTLQALRENWQDGRIKLYLIWKALSFRRTHPDLFCAGEFAALRAAGCHAQNVIAFLRRTPTASALIAVPRWLSQLLVHNETFDWCDTHLLLPKHSSPDWTSVLTDQNTTTSRRNGEPSLMLTELFRDFPVALFQS